MPATPFTDHRIVTGHLYASSTRLAQRTNALHIAKIRGADATTTLAGLAARAAPTAPVVCDIGCGRGTSTLRLAADLAPRRLIAVDQSAALLATTTARLHAAGLRAEAIQADFHRLPLARCSLDVAVAAFCLYHSAQPGRVVAEIARCLAPAGCTVLVTKSADSYRELDQVLTATGLDPDAEARPSLYHSFHSGNAAEIISRSLTVTDIVEEQHVFRFDGADQLAAYIATTPKYVLPESLRGDTGRLAAEIRHRRGDRELVTTSTLTYVTAVATP